MIRPTRSLRVPLFAATAGLLCAVALAPAQKPGTPLSGKEVFQRTLKSAIWLVNLERNGDEVRISSGSGSLIDVAGKYCLTNYHVVGKAEQMIVFFPQFDKAGKLVSDKTYYMNALQNGGGLKGKVVYRNQSKDLAIVQLPSLPSGVTAVPIAKEGAGPGDQVHSIGNPGASGALWAYTNGSVKAVYPKKWEVADRMERSVMHFDAQVVETTSPVNPGDSGGPLVNNFGELVAVTQGYIATAGTISYFIDVSEVRNVVKLSKLRINLSAGAVAPPETSGTDETKAAVAIKAVPTDNEKEEKLASGKLQLAQSYLPDSPAKARLKLEDLIKAFPNTQAAKEAKEILAKLK